MAATPAWRRSVGNGLEVSEKTAMTRFERFYKLSICSGKTEVCIQDTRREVNDQRLFLTPPPVHLHRDESDDDVVKDSHAGGRHLEIGLALLEQVRVVLSYKVVV